MFDLHSHILPHIDDGATDLATALDMARAFVDDGVEVVACSPHILPGLYHNTGPQIRAATTALQAELENASIPLKLTTGADVHIAPDLVAGLQSGELLSLADSRYVLIEPPHHVPPARIEETFFSLLLSGYVPVLTHPERLSWIRDHYPLMQRLAARGVWMQVTSGSLLGKFGKSAHYWATRMLDEGLVHILASDAHDPVRRCPDLGKGRIAAEKLLGQAEAEQLVHHRPLGILWNEEPGKLAQPPGMLEVRQRIDQEDSTGVFSMKSRVGHAERRSNRSLGASAGNLGRRLRKLFN
ncbi:MAG: tyrosine-protein phosphatase [Hyphomicrobiaceae bacterium]